MDKNEKVIIKQNLIEAYKITHEEFQKTIDQMNERWYGVIRLLITLSTSILLVSISLIDKILPLNNASLYIKNVLFIGWISFFLSIIFGILTELKGVEFTGFGLKGLEDNLKNYLREMTNKQFIEQEIPLESSFVKYPSLFWGFSTVFTFILGILCTALYSIGSIYILPLWVVLLILALVIGSMAILIFNYYRNRKTKKI